MTADAKTDTLKVSKTRRLTGCRCFWPQNVKMGKMGIVDNLVKLGKMVDDKRKSRQFTVFDKET